MKFNNVYKPFTLTLRKEANSLALSSISFSFKGLFVCNIGRSGFPLMPTNIFCFVLKSSVLISIFMYSIKITIK
jgi:hypothetical protein